VRELCAVADRWCLPLAAAVAVTVAVSPGRDAFARLPPEVRLVTARTVEGMAPCPGQASCLALGFWPECFRRLNVKGGRRSFPEETRSAFDIEGKHVTIQGPSPDLTSSVSGLLRDSAHLHQARSRCSRPLPRVAVITLDRPPDRARDGHADGSGRGGSHLSNLRILPAWIRLLISPAANIIPRIFRIMETFVATARTLQGMARVRSGCTYMEAAWIVRFSAWSS